MLNPDLRPLLKDHTSRYSLVIAVAKRARFIAEDPELRAYAGRVENRKSVHLRV